MKPSLREAANFYFSRFKTSPATRGQVEDLLVDLVQGYEGLAIGESWHGRYAFPLLMRDVMGRWADKKVTRFYTEMMPSSKQKAIDTWIDDNDPKEVVGYLNAQFLGHSRQMWRHYWLMINAAKDCGMRVIGLDKKEIASGYGAAFDAPFKNMHWDSVIEDSYESRGGVEKYVVYGGSLHVTNMGGACLGIHERRDIPRVILEKGNYAIAQMPFDRRIPSFVVKIPDVDYQEPLSLERDVRNVHVDRAPH